MRIDRLNVHLAATRKGAIRVELDEIASFFKSAIRNRV